MESGKKANDLQVNDVVTLVADVTFYAKNAEKIVVKSGTDCLIAEFSYDLEKKPNAAILEFYNSEKNFSAIATVEFQYFKLAFRTQTT